MANPWNIQSIYELQYFKCPVCVFKNHFSKQELINHAYAQHPESVDYLSKINDNSLVDVLCPWDGFYIKEEPDEIKNENAKVEDNYFLPGTHCWDKSSNKCIQLFPSK